MRPFALQGSSGLDGLPGKPGFKVIQTHAHSCTSYLYTIYFFLIIYHKCY